MADIREYRRDDAPACLAIFDSNVPRFFGEHERGGFARFLEQPDCLYFVLEHQGAPVSCGGFVVRGAVAGLVWGMVSATLHKNGLGRLLLLYRLREIGKHGVSAVDLETSQHTAAFFEKQGFRTVEVVPEGFGHGLDKVRMRKKMEVCS